MPSIDLAVIYISDTSTEIENEEAYHCFGSNFSFAIDSSPPKRVDCRGRNPATRVVRNLRAICEWDEQQGQHHKSLQLSHLRLLDDFRRPKRSRRADHSRRSGRYTRQRVHRSEKRDRIFRSGRGFAGLRLATVGPVTALLRRLPTRLQEEMRMLKPLIIAVMVLISDSAIARTSVYLGPCGGDARDARGEVQPCSYNYRPECYDDGECGCAYDPHCE